MIKVRTPNEIKAYAEGYNACYEDFRRELKQKTLSEALIKMEIIKSTVDEVAQRKEANRMELTRTVQIQLTLIDDEKKFKTSPKEAEEIYKAMLMRNAEQVLVEVKDFIREEASEGADE